MKKIIKAQEDDASVENFFLESSNTYTNSAFNTTMMNVTQKKPIKSISEH